MKTKALNKPLLLSRVIFFVFLACSCVPQINSPGSPTQELPRIVSSITATTTFTITPANNSSTPGDTPLPTLETVKSKTPTVVPTLSVEAAQLKLMNLVTDNGDCRLPCLWGITPGISTAQEARFKLEPLRSISDFTAFRTGIGDINPIIKVENGIEINLRIAFLATNNIVDRVVFDGRALKELAEENGVESIFDSSVFGEYLRVYMLHQLIYSHGVPTSIMLSTMAQIPPSHYGQDNFKILILYPDQGILVLYTTDMHMVGKNVVGCPLNAHVELYLFQSGNSMNFYKLLERTDWPKKIANNYKPLEEVTAMSQEEFYQTFRLPTDACLETPANLWPVPEK